MDTGVFGNFGVARALLASHLKHLEAGPKASQLGLKRVNTWPARNCALTAAKAAGTPPSTAQGCAVGKRQQASIVQGVRSFYDEAQSISAVSCGNGSGPSLRDPY